MDLCKVKNSEDLCHYRRKSYGVCSVNCNLRHNLHSTLGTLNMNLRSRVGKPFIGHVKIMKLTTLQMLVAVYAVVVKNGIQT